MGDTSPRRVAVNVISGALGAGKTTAINHLLSQRSEGERWAVLVNEYGEIGIDGALLTESTEAPGVTLREVAGGCICCSSGIMFHMSLVLLLARRPHRLLIEPTGLATLSGVLQALQAEGIRESIELRSMITLVDPALLVKDLTLLQTRDQLEHADIVLANRCDRASAADLEQYPERVRAHCRPNTHVARVTHGAIPIGMLDLVRHGSHPHDAHPHTHTHGPHHHAPPADITEEKVPVRMRRHRTELGTTVGWSLRGDLILDAERLRTWMLRARQSASRTRLKGVFRTDRGWWSCNYADGSEEERPAQRRVDTRIELIAPGRADLDVSALDASLRACLIPPGPPSSRTPAPSRSAPL